MNSVDRSYIYALLRAAKSFVKTSNNYLLDLFCIIKANYDSFNDSGKYNALDILVISLHFDLNINVLKFIYNEAFNIESHFEYEIKKPEDYIMSWYTIPNSYALFNLINLYNKYGDKVNIDNLYCISTVLEKLLITKNKTKRFLLLPLCHNLYYKTNNVKYLDIVCNVINEDIKFLVYPQMHRLLCNMYNYNKVKTFFIVNRAVKYDCEYINNQISTFLVYLIIDGKNILPTFMLRFNKQKEIQKNIARELFSCIDNVHNRKSLINYIVANIEYLINQDMLVEQLFYKKVLDVKADRGTIEFLLKPDFFKYMIEPFLEFVNEVDVNVYIDVLYKSLNKFYHSNLSKDYYIDRKIIGVLNRILISNNIIDVRIYNKLLKLYDYIITNNFNSCKFSYELQSDRI